MSDLELAYTPATRLADLIRNRKLSPVEVIRNSLARIEDVNPTLNCFCFTYPQEALQKARQAEAAVMQAQDLGPLHGVPVAIKDMTPTAGKTTTMGSKVYENWVPDQSAVVVQRLEAAGAILVGKTTTPEFAHAGFTHSPLWGQTRNPWNPNHTPGGSSGGSGAAVAAGCIPLAEGSDAGGSVRIPAAYCGLVGLKPSLGRIPFDILPSCFDPLFHFGPLARSVDDAALFLKITQGPSERDIQTLPAPLDIALPIDGDLRGLHLGFTMDLGFMWVHDEVQHCVNAAVDALREAGATIEPVQLGWSRDLVDGWYDYWKVFMAAFFGQHLDAWRDSMDPGVVAMIEDGFKLDAVSYKRIEIVRTAAWEKLASILSRCDALLCPTTTVSAPAIGMCDEDFAVEDESGRFRGPDITTVFNMVSQCPALSIPAGWTDDNLPVGLQIVGKRFDDATPLRIGAALERTRPWNDRRPPL